MIANKAELKKVQDAQKQKNETAEKSQKQATDAAAQLATSFLCITDSEENAKVAMDKLVD